MDVSDIHSVSAQWIMHVVEEQKSISDADCSPSQCIQSISFYFLFLTYSDFVWLHNQVIMSFSSDLDSLTSCNFSMQKSSPGFVTSMQSNEEDSARVHVICSEDSQIVAYSKIPDEIPAFLTWWKSTNAVSQLKNSSTIFCWDSRNCKSDIWQHFHEVAEYLSDASKTQCQHCKSICTHPLPKQHDTNTLSKHLLQNKCNSSLNVKQSRMSSIMESFITRRVS